MNKVIWEELIANTKALANRKIKVTEAISGGSFHQAWKLTLEKDEELFVKFGPKSALPMFLVEAKGLNILKRFADPVLMHIPQPICVRQISNSAVLILPWLKLENKSQRSLGSGLAKLHQSSTLQNPGHYGWDEDGFIGAGPQPGGWEKCWGDCFIKLRLNPQLSLAKSWGLELSGIKQTLEGLTNFLNDHQPKPSLVHGDLWSGNAFSLEDGRGVLIDPASWWADREVDIAMTKLFGGFSQDFYLAYEKVWPLPKSAETRIELYNFYHLLNHANLFGGSYQTQCHSTLKSLERLIAKL